MYKRILLKLSGEALSGNGKNLDPIILNKIAIEIKEIYDMKVEIAIVVGVEILFVVSLRMIWESIVFKLIIWGC